MREDTEKVMDNAQKVFKIISASKWRMGVLSLVSDLGLPDCWVGAGFVRNAIWDHYHGRSMTPLNDIDVIYFDRERSSARIDQEILAELESRSPKKPWSVHNQARMNERNGHEPYSSCRDAIAHWPETATAVALCVDRNQRLSIIAPHGLDDLLNLVVQPTPSHSAKVVKERAQIKRWAEIWPKLQFKF